MPERRKLSRTQLIEALTSTRRAILDRTRALPAEAQEAVFLGTWSPADLIAHLVGWDYTNIRAIEALRSRQLPAFYAQRDPDWRSYNARLVAEYKKGNFSELLRSAEQSHRQLVSSLEALSDDELARDYGVRIGRYRLTIERLMEAELEDEQVHLEQLRELGPVR